MNELVVTKHKLMNVAVTAGLIIIWAVMTHVLFTFTFGNIPFIVSAALTFGLYHLIPQIPVPIIMQAYRARKLEWSEASRLYSMLSAISTRAGLYSVPALYYIPSQSMNAFSVGSKENGAVAVSIGLVNALNADELGAVLAHEVSHLANDDQRLMRFLQTGQKIIGFLSYITVVLAVLLFPFVITNTIGISLSALIIAIVTPVVAHTVCMAISRVREYDADLEAVRLVGNPRPLMSALYKLENKSMSWWQHLLFGADIRNKGLNIFATHPPTEERLKRLKEMCVDTRNYNRNVYYKTRRML